MTIYPLALDMGMSSYNGGMKMSEHLIFEKNTISSSRPLFIFK